MLQIEMTLSVFEIYLGRCFDLLAEDSRRQFTVHFLDGAADFRELTAVPILSVEQVFFALFRFLLFRSVSTLSGIAIKLTVVIFAVWC